MTSAVATMPIPKTLATDASRPVRSLLNLLDAQRAELGARRQSLGRGQQIDIPDGENSVLIVITGLLSVATPTLEGRDAFLSDVMPGEMVGEAFALGNNTVPLTVTAREPTEVWSLRHVAYRRALSASSAFSVAAMEAMCRRQCRTNLRMAESVTLTVAERLEAELLRLASSAEQGGHTIERLPTHREIAARIATHREAVTKELNRLERAGLIRREGARLTLLSSWWKRSK